MFILVVQKLSEGRRMIVIASLLLTATLSAGLTCVNPLRTVTYSSYLSGNYMCSVLFEEPCEITSRGSHYAIVDDKTPVPQSKGITIDFSKSKNFCVLLHIREHDMIVCYCDTDYCSTNVTLIKELWRNSSTYNSTIGVSKCIENAREETSISTEGDGPWCNHYDRYIQKMWDKDSRCVMTVFCDDKGYTGYNFYVRHKKPRDDYDSRCYPLSKYGITCQCEKQFCFTNKMIYLDFHFPEDISWLETLRPCVQEILDEVTYTILLSTLPPELAMKKIDIATTPSSLLQYDDFYDMKMESEGNHRHILFSSCVAIYFVMLQIL